MDTFLYFFSRFTPEAMLFEAMGLFLLLGAYAAFWILRKRRIGAIEERPEVPTPVVKDVLTDLIRDAERLRAQLFGLMGTPAPGVGATAAGPSAMIAQPGSPAVSTGDAAAGAPGGTVSPDRLSALEAQLAAQTATLTMLMSEKTKLEAELAFAKSATGEGGAAPAANPAELETLKKRINELEGMLEEYHGLGDEFAQAIKIKQENEQLKSQISGATAAAPATPAPAPVPAAAAAPAEPATSAVATPEPSAPPVPEVAPVEATPAVAAAETPAAPAAVAAAPTPAPEAAPAPAAENPAAALDLANEKDLYDEFERIVGKG